MTAFRAFVILFTFLFTPPSAFAEQRLCDQVLIKEGRINLDANEKVLICGSDKGGQAWKSVPLAQSELHLKAYLVNRGYPKPSFERHGNELWVWTGPRLEVKKFTADPPMPVLDLARKRKVIGRPLGSEILDEVTQWADSELRSRGFACPKVQVRGQAWDQNLVLNAEPGRRGRVRRLDWEGRDGLHPSVLTRYSAIEVGDYYDVRESQLTTARLFADGLFETATIQPHCEGGHVDLLLKTSVGKPRLLTFGFGASTEEWVFIDIGFRNSRLDDRASSFTTLLHASQRQQALSLTTELYSFPFWPTVFWGPRFRTGREFERDYEVLDARAGADIGRRWDQFDSRWLVRGGPTLNYVNTVDGVGPEDTTYLNWEASVTAASHVYEFNLREQARGWLGRFDYRGQRADIGARVNVDRFDASFKYLWNINGYSPPLFVLASRFQGVAVNANPIDLRDRRDLLPLEYRVFWGGDQNLRGFARQHLSNGALGFLSGAYAGFELRLVEELPFNIQPFLLYDIARMGQKRLTLDEPLFTSWGWGLRWASPFGTVRGSAARGEVVNGDLSTLAYQEEWVYFLSFGQEF